MKLDEGMRHQEWWPSTTNAVASSATVVDAMKKSVGQLDLVATLDLVRGVMVREALTQSGGNLSHAAEVLGISRQAVQQLVRRLGLRPWLSGIRSTHC